MHRCRVLVVDDSEDMLVLIPAFLETDEDDIETVGLARDADEAYRQFLEHRPDLVILDLVLPGDSGLDIAEQILEHAPDTPIVLFSEFIDAAVEHRAQRIGVRSCVQKERFGDLPQIVREHCRAR